MKFVLTCFFFFFFFQAEDGIRDYKVTGVQTCALPIYVSLDGRYVALSDGTRAFLVDMDPQTPFAPYPAQRIGPTVDLTNCGLSSGCSIDWVSVSPSGKYVVVVYNGDYLRVYDVDPATLAFTPRP